MAVVIVTHEDHRLPCLRDGDLSGGLAEAQPLVGASTRSTLIRAQGPATSRPSGVGVVGICWWTSTTSDSRTPKTLSESRYRSPRGNTWVTSVRTPSASTIRWR